MPRQMTLTDIICNALDKDYSLEQAATDLGKLINERKRNTLLYAADAACLTELEQLIPLQEKLALGKLSGNQLFAQLNELGIRLERHD